MTTPTSPLEGLRPAVKAIIRNTSSVIPPANLHFRIKSGQRFTFQCVCLTKDRFDDKPITIEATAGQGSPGLLDPREWLPVLAADKMLLGERTIWRTIAVDVNNREKVLVFFIHTKAVWVGDSLIPVRDNAIFSVEGFEGRRKLVYGKEETEQSKFGKLYDDWDDQGIRPGLVESSYRHCIDLKDLSVGGSWYEPCGLNWR